MPATLTVTGTAGPGNTVSATVFNGVTSFTISTETNMLTFIQNSINREISINAATTITATKSGTAYTLTIS